MEFRDTLITNVLTALRVRRSPFTYVFHTYIHANQKGVYAFWLQQLCLYVGMSKDLRKRIYVHRIREHNVRLGRYLSAFAQDIEVAYVALKVNSDQELKELEKETIRFLRPATNIIHASS